MLHLRARLASAAPLLLTAAPARAFRVTFKNPYLSDAVPMTDAEREAQTNLPVWERQYD